MFSDIIIRLRALFRRTHVESELDSELRYHLDRHIDKYVRAGLTPAEARRRAQLDFGALDAVKDECRDARGVNFFESFLQDIRFAFRLLRRTPALTAVALLSLALGIGANTAIFSILNAVMLRSLPVEDPHQIVQVRSRESGDEYTNLIWEEVRDHQQAFSGALAYSQDRFDLADGGQSHFAEGLWVSGDYFRVLGVPAIQGRVFTSEDDQHGGGKYGAVAVISYRFWKQNFPGVSRVIGKTIHLDRRTFEIVGVTPPWFAGLEVDRAFDVAIPIGCEPLMHPDLSALNERSYWWLRIVGRMPPGETLDQAQARMKALSPAVFRATLPTELNGQDGQEYLKSTLTVAPAARGLSESVVQYRPALFVLMAIVGLVLLIACGNIANLLLARSAARQREFSVRMAMGGSRARIVRQLMTESLVLATLGAGLGFLLALWGSWLLVHLFSTGTNPMEVNLSPDPHVLGFTLGVALLTAFLFGLAPALRATRVPLNQSLKESAGSARPGATRFNLLKALLAGQAALAFVLLTGAGLFLTTLRNLLTVDPGFNRQNILLISADAKQVAIPKEQRVRVYDEILQGLRGVPGVTSAAASGFTPISERGWSQFAYPEGFRPQTRMDALVYLNRVSPGYFKTLKTPLLLGRDFTDHDDLSAPNVMIISELSARHFFGKANPIGKTIALDKFSGAPGEKEKFEVVGVVKDTKYRRLNETPRRLAYLASGQDDDPESAVRYEVRTAGPADALIPSIRAAIAGVNGGVSLEFSSLESQVNESLLRERVVALLSTVFGALAVLLAMVGLYGVTSYAVTRRRGEIGIRMSLGAGRRSVVWLIMRDLAMVLVAGVVMGLAGSLALGRLVTSFLYGIRPNDPLELAATALILALATGLAAYLPARRAARLDPMAALRYE